MRILVVFGTRPEAIKLAPVVLALADRPREFSVRVCVTAQHREMLDQVLDLYAIRPDHDLDIMRPDQTLPDLTATALLALGRVLATERPDLVVVQGDTTTTMTAALAAFYAKIPVAHVEAGLRTRNKYAPFPEEVNRQVTSVIADLHFAPTDGAKQNLIAEGISAARVHVTGNTVVDALVLARRKLAGRGPSAPELQRLDAGRRTVILVTAHRRESFGAGLENVCRAIRDLVDRNADLAVVFPVHLNPNVRAQVRRVLTGDAVSEGRLILTEPLSYTDLVWVLDRCRLVLTDSGGIQEEAPTFHKPVLVMRDITERPEGVDAGVARLVGTDLRRIRDETERLLHDEGAYATMTGAGNPYGDGRAAERIMDVIRRRQSG
jgi:UDP-N-acetylglucosamine 2-epimerase (non-hydrolysing)